MFLAHHYPAAMLSRCSNNESRELLIYVSASESDREPITEPENPFFYEEEEKKQTHSPEEARRFAINRRDLLIVTVIFLARACQWNE
jgi:hypothetical protein